MPKAYRLILPSLALLAILCVPTASPAVGLSARKPVLSGNARVGGGNGGSNSSRDLLFDGSFDPGFSSWYLQSLSYRATLVPAGSGAVGQAARFEVREGDVEPDTGSQRSEVAGPTFSEGQDLYVHDGIRLPEGNDFNAPWQIVEQLHEDPWDGSPGLAVFLEDDHSLRISSGDSTRPFWQGPRLASNRWYDLVYRVKLSQDPTVGFVEVWLDGVQQTLVNGESRIYGETIQAAKTFIKAGVYRSRYSTGTSIVEHDGIRVGTSFAAVSAG
jgi:hypothetical protein